MSSWSKGTKASTVHRERPQPASRRKMGFLEKKKDYKKRALDHQRKEAKMKSLRKKAKERNPDEFYYKMVNTHLDDGEHVEEEKPIEYSEDQLKIMTIQDERYLNYKRQIERKKIEKLKSSLHMIDADTATPRKHTFFVDKKVKNFDVAKHLDTHPLLLGRPSNRVRMSDLAAQASSSSSTSSIPPVNSEKAELKLIKERNKSYKELEKRIERETEIFRHLQRLGVKKSLNQDKQRSKVQVAKETATSAAQYKFAPKRKR